MSLLRICIGSNPPCAAHSGACALRSAPAPRHALLPPSTLGHRPSLPQSFRRLLFSLSIPAADPRSPTSIKKVSPARVPPHASHTRTDSPIANPTPPFSRPRRSFPPHLLSQPRRSHRPCFSLGLAAVHRSGFFRLRTLLRPASSLGLGALFSPLILSLGLAVFPRPISYLSLSALLRPGSCCLQFAACRFPPPLKIFIYKVKAFSRAHAHRKNNINK